MVWYYWPLGMINESIWGRRSKGEVKLIVTDITCELFIYYRDHDLSFSLSFSRCVDISGLCILELSYLFWVCAVLCVFCFGFVLYCCVLGLCYIVVFHVRSVFCVIVCVSWYWSLRKHWEGENFRPQSLWGRGTTRYIFDDRWSRGIISTRRVVSIR